MPIKRILVPVDFSAPSLQALEYAIEFGKPFKAQLVVLFVVDLTVAIAPMDMYGAGAETAMVQAEQQRGGREQLARLSADLKKRRLAFRSVLQMGSPSPVIVDTAKKLKADLIVMGTHGRTGLSHVLLGSVAERVVRTASCAVLTVRGYQPPRRAARRTTPRKARR